MNVLFLLFLITQGKWQSQWETSWWSAKSAIICITRTVTNPRWQTKKSMTPGSCGIAPAAPGKWNAWWGEWSLVKHQVIINNFVEYYHWPAGGWVHGHATRTCCLGLEQTFLPVQQAQKPPQKPSPASASSAPVVKDTLVKKAELKSKPDTASTFQAFKRTEVKVC